LNFGQKKNDWMKSRVIIIIIIIIINEYLH